MKFFFVLLIALVIPGQNPVSASEDNEIRIGVRAHRGAAAALKKWGPTIDYLNQAIPEQRFVLIPYVLNSELNQAASRKDFDLFLTNPAAYIELNKRYGATAIATLTNKRMKKGYTRFGSAIITRSDRQDINSFKDLKGKSFMAVDDLGFGGWFVAWREMRLHEIDPYKDFSILTFAGGLQQKVVYAVRDGIVDAGSIRTDMLERMTAEGKIKLDDFKIVSPRITPGFKFLHSTRLYPEWPFAKLPHIPNELTQKITHALLSILQDSKAAKAGKYIRWIEPLDYGSVDTLLHELGVGPYSHKDISLTSFLKKYLGTILSLLAIAIVAILVAVHTTRTNRKLLQVKNALMESERNLIKGQEIGHMGNWNLNIKTGVVAASDELLNIFELDRDKLSLENIFNATHPLDRNTKLEDIKQSIEKAKPWDIEYRLLLNNGTIKWIFSCGEPAINNNNKTTHIMGIIQDISKQKQTEEALNQSQKMEALGKLTGGIAHEFNNMLGIILGYSELLKSYLENDPNQKLENYVQQILTAGERGAKLTNKLLSFTRQKQTEAISLNINSLLNDEKDMLEKSLTSSINLIFDLTDDLWPVRLDKADFTGAILNISINAMHAMESESGGTLTIKTRNVSLNTIEANNYQLEAGDYVRLCLSDTGTGIDIDIQDKIFDPFFTSKGELGTGLGLSQVYGFIERSKGAIEVNSQPGQGTQFSLYFPRHDNINELVRTTNTLPDSYTGSETILVVDDEPALLNMTKEVFQQKGYQVKCAENGKQALDIIKNEPVDLIFCDIIMPEINGHQLASIVRHDYPNIKIQLVSGFSEEAGTDAEDHVSSENILQKPYKPQTLLQRAKELLGTD